MRIRNIDVSLEISDDTFKAFLRLNQLETRWCT